MAPNTQDSYDVVVIGAGPGGYVAAIRAAQLGLSTACVDDFVDAKGKPAPGGTCLNVGCIPSKALLDSSHHYYDLQHSFAGHGIKTSGASIDVPTMIARKSKVVEQLTRGVTGLFRKNKVESICGRGALLGDGKVEVSVEGQQQKRVLSAGSIIVATGSTPIDLSVAPVDGVHIVDNVGALAFDEVPERLGVIGAGVIGLELGSVWSRLGAKAVLLEALPDFLAAADPDVAKAALKSYKKQGLDIRLGAKVTGAKAGNAGVTITYQDAKGAEQTLEVDKLIVAVGRKANTRGLEP